MFTAAYLRFMLFICSWAKLLVSNKLMLRYVYVALVVIML